MKKPYLFKLKKISEFNVFIVEGEYIRKNIDEEFTNFGQHYRFDFIPDNEFWIDKEYSPGEENFYIFHMIVEHFLMSMGINYVEALEKTDILEDRERKKSRFFLKFKKKHKKREFVEGIHKKLLKKYSKKIKVWVVNGEIVRDLFFIDFTQGGHFRVYDFVPKEEIWLDDDLSSKERKYVLLHEVHELNLMGKGMSYSDAHNHSSHIEYYCRKNPDKLNEYLESEFKKISSN